jgi:hypothetical protein
MKVEASRLLGPGLQVNKVAEQVEQDSGGGANSAGC